MRKKTLLFMIVLTMLATLVIGGSQAVAETTETTDSFVAEATNPWADEPTADMRVVYLTWGGESKDMQMVEDQFNEQYGIPLLNANVHFEVINSGAWTDQSNVILSSGEDVDLLMCFLNYGTTMAGAGTIQPLTESLENYGQDIMASISENIWDVCTYKDDIYEIPNKSRSMCAAYAALVRTDLMEKYGFTVDDFQTTEGIENMLSTIKENEPSITYPLLSYVGGISNCLPVEGDFYVTPDDDCVGAINEDGTGRIIVEDYFKTSMWLDHISTAKRWYDAGYCDPNALITSEEDRDTYFNNGEVFMYLTSYGPQYEDYLTTRYGNQDCEYITLQYLHNSTGKVQVFGWVVPQGSKDVDRAVALMNIFYGDVNASNLLGWGVEGVHYELTGTDDREITYPEGVTADNVGYSNPMNFAFGNFFDGYYMQGTSSDQQAIVDEFDSHALPSRIDGFTFDVSPIKTQYAAVSAVYSQYQDLFQEGIYDESTLETFYSQMEIAGYSEIRAEFQRQLDTWAGVDSE
jgi:putative aldouronate transport system substrate-binding protein